MRNGMAWLLAALLLASGLPGVAAAQARVPLLPESRVRVEGTSNKSDWAVQARELSGFVVVRAGAEVLEVVGGGFSVVSAGLKSEHGVIMDRLMHNALRSAEYPEIQYELLAAQATPQGAGRYALVTRGRLTLAGVAKEIEQTVAAERTADGRLRFTGSQPIDMPEYGITPPTAMFGSLRTGRRVVVHFDLLVKP